MEIERGRDGSSLFLTFLSVSQYDELPSKRPAGIERRWSPLRLTSWLITLSLFFLSDRLSEREGEWDFSISVLFRFYQSPKRQMNPRSLLFHDNNHPVTSHIKLNLCYMSLQINLCQPSFDSLLILCILWASCNPTPEHCLCLPSPVAQHATTTTSFTTVIWLQS